MVLNDKLLRELKKPLGVLIPDGHITYQNLLNYAEKTAKTISVGDRTSLRLISLGIIPHISVVDGIEQRNKNDHAITTIESALDLKETLSMTCENPAGSISNDSLAKIRLALASEKKVILKVNGEEDLLTLAFCWYAPDNSIIFYGQPNSGMVIIGVDDIVRIKAESFIRRIRGE
jgi:uncharacterized protein (UPF0218 family)